MIPLQDDLEENKCSGHRLRFKLSSAGLPRWLSGKEARDAGSVPRSGRSPGVGNCNPLQCSCLESSTDRGTWRAAVHGVARSWMQLSTIDRGIHIPPP